MLSYLIFELFIILRSVLLRTLGVGQHKCSFLLLARKKYPTIAMQNALRKTGLQRAIVGYFYIYLFISFVRFDYQDMSCPLGYVIYILQ